MTDFSVGFETEDQICRTTDLKAETFARRARFNQCSTYPNSTLHKPSRKELPHHSMPWCQNCCSLDRTSVATNPPWIGRFEREKRMDALLAYANDAEFTPEGNSISRRRSD